MKTFAPLGWPMALSHTLLKFQQLKMQNSPQNSAFASPEGLELLFGQNSSQVSALLSVDGLVGLQRARRGANWYQLVTVGPQWKCQQSEPSRAEPSPSSAGRTMTLEPPGLEIQLATFLS